MIARVGLGDFTVADVARSAGVSTALVHYHFATKQQLLEAAGAQLAAERGEGRRAALAGASGLGALDALWAGLETSAADGPERACCDLALHARADAALRARLAAARSEEQRVLAARLPGLLAELGAGLPVSADDAASLVTRFLDGAALDLAGGASADDVRAAYDAFWLVLVKAAPAPAAR